MDISVIVVTYNQEFTIRRTLDSILAQQTEADFEIVIGDDCSTDGTESICLEYADKYPDKIVYLRRENNLGLVLNYYDCIARARGRYLSDCAGDDYWCDEHKLQKQFEILSEREDVTLVASGWECEDSTTGKRSFAPNACPPGEYDGKELMVPILTNEKVIHLSSSMFRKEIIDNAVKENPELFANKNFSAEDIQILLTCCQKGKIIVLPEVMLIYSTGHESISHKKNFKDKFTYSLRSRRQQMKLQDFFLKVISEKNRQQLEEYNAKRLAHIIYLLFHSGPTIDLPSADSIVSEFYENRPFEKYLNREKTLKTRLYRFLMKEEWLWRMGLRFF